MLNLFQHLIEKQMFLLTTGNFGYRHTYQVLGKIMEILEEQ
jgi:hypothetical protein